MVGEHVRDVHRTHTEIHSSDHRSGITRRDCGLGKVLAQLRRYVRGRGNPEHVAVEAPDESAICSAEADRIVEHGLEDRLELVTGAADDGQDLACGGLLLDRLRQLAGGRGKPIVQPRLAFARTGQDHPLPGGCPNGTRPMSQDHTGWYRRLLAPGRWVPSRRVSRSCSSDPIRGERREARAICLGVIADGWRRGLIRRSSP